MPVYGIERGDVLLSLQLALTHEEEVGPKLVAVPTSAAPRTMPQTGNGSAHPGQPKANGASHPGPAQATRPGFGPGARHLPGIPPAPRRPVVMVDPTTGAGTMAALRRDLSLQRTSAGMPGGKVVGVEIQTLDQFRLVLGSGAADEVIRGLVEVAPFALQARDRVYRFGRDKLILWLGASKDAEVEKARLGLEEAVTRFLADRGFPEVRLLARTLDPAAIAR